MKEHAIQPCEMAIKEITHLSKATINNLRSKVGAKSMKIFNIISNIIANISIKMFSQEDLEFATLLKEQKDARLLVFPA